MNVIAYGVADRIGAGNLLQSVDEVHAGGMGVRHGYVAVVELVFVVGTPLNNLTIDTCKLTDEKNMGVHLQGLAQRTDTHGQYQRVGEVYGFPIAIISERVLDEGSDLSCFNSSSLPHFFDMIPSRVGTSALSLTVRSSYRCPKRIL